jgi:UDP-glucose 4-epimerase
VKVVVTGGHGFIGRAVCEALDETGNEAVSFDRASGQDVLTATLPPADHVIHLAGVLGTDELFDDPELAVDVNIKGTLNVLRWCVDNGAGYTGILMPPVFPSVYTATKLCAEHLAKAWHHTYGLPVSHVRAFNAFGAGQKHGPGHPRKIVPAFAHAAWRGEPLTVWGDGEQTVDLVHVDDLAWMLVDAVDFGGCEVFDAGTGTAHTVNEVARMVIEATGSSSPIEHHPMRRGETPTRIVAEGDGWELLDWKPEFRRPDLDAAVGSYRP